MNELHNKDLTFLSEKIKVEKVEKFVGNFHNKEEYFINMKDIK